MSYHPPGEPWQPTQYPPHKPLPHQRFWRWFRQRSTLAQIIACVVLILSCSLCWYAASASTSSVATTTAIPTATQDIAAITARIDATATQNAQVYQETATAAPTETPFPSPTVTPKSTVLAVKPTPKPTQPPAKPTPTPKPHCIAVNNNPWCYSFSPGGLIYTPPDGFCNYFNCIASFYGADDPGDGYIVECSDATFSQSGGESGACSHHGGVMRPLYSH